MKILLITVLLVFVGATSDAEIDTLARSRFVNGRSGDVFIVPKKGYAAGGSSILFPKDEFSFPGSSIPDVVISDILAHNVGVEPIRLRESAPFLPKQSIFSKSKANAFFVVDSFGDEVLTQFPDLVISSLSKKVAVKETSLLQDSLALVCSVNSGMDVAQHGIVGRSWFKVDGSKVSAFSSSQSGSKVASFADRVSESFGGKSLVFSASADKQLSAALGVHPALLKVSGNANADSMFWNKIEKRFQSLNDIHKVVVVSEKFPQILAAFPHSVLVAGESVTIPFGGKKATFLFHHEPEFLFLVELEFFLQKVSVLKVDEVAKDDIPDIFAFAFSSLKLLKSYGLKSEKFEVALRSVDGVIVSVIGTLKELYNGKLSWEVLFADQTNIIQEGHAAINLVSKELDKTNTLAFGIDVFSRSQSPQDVCDKLNGVIWSKELLAVCPVSHISSNIVIENVQQHHLQIENIVQKRSKHIVYRTLVTRDSYQDNGNETSTITSEEIVAFQMVFWITLAFFLIFLFGIALVSTIDIPAESPLHRNLPDIYRQQGTVIMRELGTD